MPTPYDGDVAVWYVHGRTVGENTIDEIITTLRNFAPAVRSVFVKVGEANEWMGNIAGGDPKPDLAIRSVADIDRWVNKLGQAGLEFHAWHIPKGILPTAEADFLLQVCTRPGVRSLILDVEPYEGYFAGGRAAVRPFMLRLRAGLPPGFHIGMSVDPRPWHYNSIFPDEWRTFIDSLHPQVYWADFTQTPEDALRTTYDTWGSYGLPIIPILQGYQGRGNQITREAMDRARQAALRVHRAPGLSWFRFGTLSRALFPAVNVMITGEAPPDPNPDPTPSQGRYGTSVIVKPGEAGWREGTYDGTPSPLQTFRNEAGWTSRYKATTTQFSTAWTRWDPGNLGGGFWELSVYVPSQHGTTRNARYQIHGIVGQSVPLEAALNQVALDSLWAPLGIFNLNNAPSAGVVFLNDLTGERSAEISFDAIRWRQVLGWPNPPRYLSDGLDAPVGTPQERDFATTTWPPTWYSSNPYKNRYSLLGRESLHTGDDLVLRRGRTFGQPIYAASSGVVLTARRLGTPPNWGSWGNVIVIRHDPLVTTGQVVYSRYAHVDAMQVRPGERVVRGQYIATLSDAFGVFSAVPHLHFDISPTRILETSPGDWPWLDEARLTRDYANPRTFVYGNRAKD
jgi:murein DD-endopeptidase MepM/ murein hydrolase activator NlpD